MSEFHSSNVQVIVPANSHTFNHHTRRTSRKNDGFNWGRFPSFDVMGNCIGVHYRLFRRDHTGAIHMLQDAFYRECDRATIARSLRRMRKTLRDQVDEIDLAAMGIAA